MTINNTMRIINLQVHLPRLAFERTAVSRLRTTVADNAQPVTARPALRVVPTVWRQGRHRSCHGRAPVRSTGPLSPERRLVEALAS
jgi:hypothetical protein